MAILKRNSKKFLGKRFNPIKNISGNTILSNFFVWISNLSISIVLSSLRLLLIFRKNLLMKKIILPVLLSLAIIAVSAFTFLNSKGGGCSAMHAIGEACATGSPLDQETCAKYQGCHYNAGPSTPTLTIAANPSFGIGNTYVPGTTYTINVTCAGGYKKYGIGLEILNSNLISPPNLSSIDAGTFGTALTANVQLNHSSADDLTEVEQTAPSGPASGATFSFTWTAPSSDTAYLYCAGLGANMDSTSDGDGMDTTSMVLTPCVTGFSSIEENLFHLTIFPNPASDHTAIEYTLEENSDIKIELYDVAGKKICELLSEKQNAGSHRQSLNIREMNLKSGVYILRMQANNKNELQKFVVK